MCFISNKMPQKNFGQPNATGGVYSNPPDPLAGGKGEGENLNPAGKVLLLWAKTTPTAFLPYWTQTLQCWKWQLSWWHCSAAWQTLNLPCSLWCSPQDQTLALRPNYMALFSKVHESFIDNFWHHPQTQQKQINNNLYVINKKWILKQSKFSSLPILSGA